MIGLSASIDFFYDNIFISRSIVYQMSAYKSGCTAAYTLFMQFI